MMRRRPLIAPFGVAALANKTARMIWAIMTSGQPYKEPELRAT
jgi:hypothetical protein